MVRPIHLVAWRSHPSELVHLLICSFQVSGPECNPCFSRLKGHPSRGQVAPGFVQAIFRLIAGVPTKYVQDSIPSILAPRRSRDDRVWSVSAGRSVSQLVAAWSSLKIKLVNGLKRHIFGAHLCLMIPVTSLHTIRGSTVSDRAMRTTSWIFPARCLASVPAFPHKDSSQKNCRSSVIIDQELAPMAEVPRHQDQQLGRPPFPVSVAPIKCPM